MKGKIFTGMISILLIVSLTGCDEDPEYSIEPGPFFTGDDAYNDLTVLGNRFYLTNFDANEGPGDRINLYSFDQNTQPLASFNLQMNGQGYISICSGDGDLFLFCHLTGNLLRVSPFGELINTNWLDVLYYDLYPGGLLHISGDEFYAALWTPDDTVSVYAMNPDELTLESIDKQIPFPQKIDFRSLCINDQLDSLYMLCSDSYGADYIEVMDSDWTQSYEIALSDSSVAGITVLNGEIWVSTEDRRIVKLSEVQ